MSGLRKLHAFCTRDPEHYPSRLEIQRELERLLEEEKESLECPHAQRPLPCPYMGDCPSGFEWDSVRNICRHKRGPSVILTMMMEMRDCDAIREGDAMMAVQNKDGSMSAAVIKNIGRE